MTDLKPCPFCGGPGEEWEKEGGYPWLFIKVVGCRKCHISFYNDKGDEGVTKWNRRVENLKEVDVDSLAECEYSRPTFRTGAW